MVRFVNASASTATPSGPPSEESLRPEESGPSRLYFGLAVFLCCLATWIIKTVVNAPRTGVNHGDISFYVTVARNLAEGRGFVIDYIWNFWSHPEGIPTPSNLWWMPMASIIGAAGMKVFGTTDYGAAQSAMILFTSLTPLVTYLLARELFGRPIGLAGAVLATSFHLFLDQPSAPLSHGPFLVFSTLTLWLICKSMDRPFLLLFTGMGIALTHLSRTDGLLLVGSLAAAWLIARVRPTTKHLLLLLLGYALVMSPWWARNLQDFDTIQPGGSSRAVFLRDYEAWYSLPESVTAETYLQDGWSPVIGRKVSVGRNNLGSLATGMTSGANQRKRVWDHPFIVGLMILSWIGLLSCSRRRFGFLWAHAALLWIFYSLVFTAVGTESFRTGMYSLYPFLLACSAKGLQTVTGFLTRRPSASSAAMPGPLFWACLLLLSIGQFSYAKSSLVIKSEGIDRLNLTYRDLKTEVLEPLGLLDATFMARDVHELHATLGVRCVQIPYEEEPAIREVAQRYGVTHILLMGEHIQQARPALAKIDEDPRYERVAGPFLIRGTPLQIYAIRNDSP